MNKFYTSLRRSLMLLSGVTMVFLFVFLPLSAAAADKTAEQSLIGGPDSGLVNILLIGQDRRDADTAARSDSIILCSFRPEEKRIMITSFLRDLYVQIPGYQSNRLNAAYAYGGMELLQQTMEHNFNLHIDGCIEADFSQFPQIIDALGGVSIELRQDEADSINKSVTGTLTAGTNLLNGEQALAYSRIRRLDSDGDFSRTGRQRKLLSSLLDSYRSADLLTILGTVADTLPLISTDLGKRQILVLAAKLYPLLDSPAIISQRIPADGTYAYETIRNMEVLNADMNDIRKQLQKLLLPINESAGQKSFS